MARTSTEYRPVPIPNRHRGRWWAAGGVALTVLAGSVGAGAFASGDDPQVMPASTTVRTINDDEALRLALMRFANHGAGGSHFRAEVPWGRGSLFVDGDVDHRRNIGFGQISGPRSALTMQWDKARLARWSSEAGTVRTPESLPLGKPGLRRLDRPTPVDSVLALVVSLGTDRPEDAVRLRRAGARWLGTERLGGVVVDVLSGPGFRDGSGAVRPVRYLVGKDGRLLAVDIVIDGRAPTRIHLDREGYRRFQVSTALRK